MDVDLEAVNSQIGTAIIDSSSGEVRKVEYCTRLMKNATSILPLFKTKIQSTGELSGEAGLLVCQYILRILKVSSKIM